MSDFMEIEMSTGLWKGLPDPERFSDWSHTVDALPLG